MSLLQSLPYVAALLPGIPVAYYMLKKTKTDEEHTEKKRNIYFWCASTCLTTIPAVCLAPINVVYGMIYTPIAWTCAISCLLGCADSGYSYTVRNDLYYKLEELWDFGMGIIAATIMVYGIHTL